MCIVCGSGLSGEGSCRGGRVGDGVSSVLSDGGCTVERGCWQVCGEVEYADLTVQRCCWRVGGSDDRIENPRGGGGTGEQGWCRCRGGDVRGVGGCLVGSSVGDGRCC